MNRPIPKRWLAPPDDPQPPRTTHRRPSPQSRCGRRIHDCPRYPLRELDEILRQIGEPDLRLKQLNAFNILGFILSLTAFAQSILSTELLSRSDQKMQSVMMLEPHLSGAKHWNEAEIPAIFH